MTACLMVSDFNRFVTDIALIQGDVSLTPAVLSPLAMKVEAKRSSAANYSICAAPTLGIVVDVRALPGENN